MPRLLLLLLQFEFNYSSLEKPHIQNDVVTLHRKAARDHQVKRQKCGAVFPLPGFKG